MSIALHNKVRGLEARIEALENAFSVLAKAQPSPHEDVEQLKVEIRMLKARMGRIRDLREETA